MRQYSLKVGITEANRKGTYIGVRVDETHHVEPASNASFADQMKNDPLLVQTIRNQSIECRLRSFTKLAIGFGVNGGCVDVGDAMRHGNHAGTFGNPQFGVLLAHSSSTPIKGTKDNDEIGFVQLEQLHTQQRSEAGS